MQIQNAKLMSVVHKHASWAATLILALVAVWLAAQLIWQLVAPTKVIPTGPIKVASVQQSTPVALQNLQALNLFGTADAPAAPTTRNAPKTSLNLRLLGVSASNVPTRSAAIIEQRGAQEVYVIGDTLSGTRVEIKEIYADRVILDNNGRLETLELEGIGELSEGLSLTMANVNAQRQQATPPRPTLEQRAQQLVHYIRITPVREGNKLKGYQLSPGADARLFNQAGFKRGDIAVAINGEDLTNVTTAVKMSRDFNTMTKATVTVVRGTEYIDVQLDINDLPQGD